ncbi:16S rRNA (guanine(527)-N(7))-methyltransferase RsmG [uncultured Amaricoccus sp.]|uniref:16S rRNA (guanine(527)-N(7))-methyltransferase RsmG n=1 Tax=uncultured Amaricoccus sp. TaxID=339341 RepID=UPI0026303B86|nr:16S rRNA (guanine(527)-N(7))-methyltransferase RsmG [uncultured Amaricoccus sp.]
MSAPETLAGLDVSRETLERLTIYHDLLRKWNAKINLVSRASLEGAWTRHFADSLQLLDLAPPRADRRSWVDLGAGAGFPGLVVAIARPDVRVLLVESDARKVAFLRAVATATGVSPIIHEARIEALPGLDADILSARALAPLAKLLAYAEKHRAPTGICLFPKGGTVHKEIADAERQWRFEYRVHPSRTDPEAAIVEIGALARA